MQRIMEFPSPKSLISTYKDVVNQYCNGEKKITVNSFELLEKGLRVSGAYKERVDSCLCKIITPVLSNQKSKDLILDNAKDYRKIIKQANDIQDFEKALRNAWGDEDASKILPNKS